MKRTIIAVGLAFGTLILGVVEAGVASQQAQPISTVSVAPVAVQRPVVWQEDSLPTDLYLWADCNDRPCRALRHVRRYDGHRDCWMAVGADTSLVLCSDGYRTVS